MINEDKNFKPTLKDPVNDQSADYEDNFKRTMAATAPTVQLNEVDGMLSEVEQSLKKKIFSLAKMEALVFSDPKLTNIYNEMSENGEEKYGYHYNETIQNMIFNDYVLNSPKYLQKYKMAVPKKKKRRDKSGINKLKKAGEETMKKKNPAFKVKKPDLEESDEQVVKVMFLVNEKDPRDPDLFAYFPEEDGDNQGNKTAYSHIGQHSAASPEYAAESRPATPEEYQDLKAELENQVGYNLEVLNGMQETTGAAGASGAFAPALGYEKKVAEGSTTGSVGGATGEPSGAYYTNAAWGAGDLMGGKKSKVMSKPIWKGGTIIQESNYLTETDGFQKYVEALNEESDADFIARTGSNTYGAVDNMSPENQKIIKNDIQNRKFNNNSNIKGSIGLNEYLMQDALFDKGIVDIKSRDGETRFKMSDGGEYEYMTVIFTDGSQDIGVYSYGDDVVYDYNKWRKNMGIDESNVLQEEGTGMLTTPEQVKALGRKLTKADIPNLAGQALYQLAIQLAGQLLPFGWDDLPDINSMWDYIDKNGGMTYEQLKEAVREAVEERIAEDGMSLDDLGLEENNLQEKSKSKSQQRFFGMVDAVKKGELSPNKAGASVAKAAKGMSMDDVEDFAKTKHKGLPDHVDEEENMEKQVFNKGDKVFDKLHNSYGIVLDNYGDPENGDGGDIRLDSDGNVPIFQHDDNWNVIGYNLTKVEENNIKETELSMIDTNNSSAANKAQPLGDQGGSVPTGTQQAGGLQESESLLEELNNELNAYSIHHDKLKKMAEERKPSALVLRDRVGSENETNFKKDLQHSGVKQVIDIEKELEYKAQQTDVGKDPMKLGQDIEKLAIKTGDMKGDEALKNVGDSANDDGDEVTKRNLTTDEQDDVDLYRKGQHSWVYDNEPGKRFEDRMAADMGDKIMKMRDKQLTDIGKNPMYNKDSQPVDDGIDKVQFDKEKSGWNEREGIEESMITGRYNDILNKRRLVDFKLDEVKGVTADKLEEGFFVLDFTGLGNVYNSRTIDNKVIVTEGMSHILETYKFYTDGKNVVATKNPVQSLNESKSAEKPVINEQAEKMKHLLGYKPDSYVNTTNVKKNRGF